MNKVYLAADFGGGSGRVIAGWLEDGQLKMEEVHRFGNRQVRLGNHVYWDFPALFEDMKAGLKKAAAKGYKVESIGVDTWGVDFGLIDRDGQLIGNPVCYRDARTAGMVEEMFKTLNPTEHYATTGIQVMEINTLPQLLSIKGTAQLESAQHLLFNLQSRLWQLPTQPCPMARTPHTRRCRQMGCPALGACSPRCWPHLCRRAALCRGRWR